MDRKDPYIGDGTAPAPMREREAGSRAVPIVVAMTLLAAAAGGVWLWWRDRAPPMLPPERASAPAAPTLPLAQAPQHPVASEPAEQPLPQLKESDGPVAAALSALVGLDTFGGMFVTENLVRNIVATVDNLPREEVSQRVNPVRSAPGLPVTTGKGTTLALAPANSSRYLPYIRALDKVGTKDLVTFYRRHYPLFQQAYVELGYPKGYFNDRLVEVIDHLLATPEPAGALRLTQPKVLYEYADPQLEELSAGQKTMLRIGRENREHVKAKLREIRTAITTP